MYWADINEDVENIIKGFPTCRKYQKNTTKGNPKATLGPIQTIADSQD